MSRDSGLSPIGGPGVPSGGTGGAMRARRQALGWSLQKLAELLGCAKGYLSEVETGRRSPPSDDMLAKAEMVMMMPEGSLTSIAGWERGLSAGGKVLEEEFARFRRQSESARRLADLLKAHARNPANDTTKVEGNPLDRAYASGELRRLIEQISPGGGPSLAPTPLPKMLPTEVPLINKVAAGYPREFTDMTYPARVADEYVRCPDVQDPDAFAARVVGDSMSPDYVEGDIVVFSPSREIESGLDCFVRLERDHETTFKRVYFEKDASGREMIRLQPVNNAYAPRVLEREEVAGLYAAVRSIRNVDRKGPRGS